MAVNTDSIVSNLYSTYSSQSKTGKTNKENATGTENSKVSKTNGNYGKTIGNAKLSEEGAKYYQELKKKYSNMDFILVSKDQKANAQANAASYANGNKMVVLIDEEKSSGWRQMKIIENSTRALLKMQRPAYHS